MHGERQPVFWMCFQNVHTTYRSSRKVTSKKRCQGNSEWQQLRPLVLRLPPVNWLSLFSIHPARWYLKPSSLPTLNWAGYSTINTGAPPGDKRGQQTTSKRLKRGSDDVQRLQTAQIHRNENAVGIVKYVASPSWISIDRLAPNWAYVWWYAPCA